MWVSIRESSCILTKYQVSKSRHKDIQSYIKQFLPKSIVLTFLRCSWVFEFYPVRLKYVQFLVF